MATKSMNASEPKIGEILTDPGEIKFIRAWRSADDAGKRDLDKLLHAAGAGLLPPVEVTKAMTVADRRAFIDSLPETRT